MRAKSLSKRLFLNDVARTCVVEIMERRMLLSGAPLTGTVIGTSGSYNNHGTVAADAFDGNLGTYFDATTASGSWTGLSFAAPDLITQISYAPRSGFASRMVGGVFEGSETANFASNLILYTVTTAPAVGQYTTVEAATNYAYKFFRYVGPANSYCNVADIKVYGTPAGAGATEESDGTLLVNGTTGNDTIYITTSEGSPQEGTELEVTVNNAGYSFDAAFISSIQVNTFGGNDLVDVYAYTNYFTPAPINIVAGNGNDTFIALASSGSIGGTAGPSRISISAGNGNDTFAFTDANLNASVTAGNGNDTLITANSPDAYTGTQTISFSAGSGQDYVYNNNNSTGVVTGTLGGEAYSISPVQAFLVGKEYADLNGDGMYEAGEPTIAGAPVTFENSQFGTFSTNTDSTGGYILPIPTSSSNPFINAYAGDTLYVLSEGELISGVDFALPQPLGGTAIGTSGSYNNDGNTITKAFDGNPSTFFDGPTANGNYAGRNLGSPTAIGSIAYAPRSGWASRMVGGMFQGSNSPTFSNPVTLYTITSTPVTGVLTYVPVTDSLAFQYVRYLSPAGSYGDVSEVQFFAAPPPSAVLGSNGILTITGTNGSDNISVGFSIDEQQTGTAGTYTTDVDGISGTFAAETVTAVLIETFDGNDSVGVSGQEQYDSGPPAPVNVFIYGGAGDDTVNSEISNSDELVPLTLVTSGDGNDNVTVTGGGSAVISLGNGTDVAQTNAIESYLQVTMLAGNGNDTLIAGEAGNGGQNVSVIAGSGQDQIINGDIDDHVTAQVGSHSYTFSAIQSVLAGVVYDDSNGDGKYEPGEPLVADFPISGSPAQSTSDSSGYYSLSYTLPGFPSLMNVSIGLTTLTLGSGVLLTGFDIPTISLVPQFTSTIIGTPGSYRNHGTSIANVFDGNLSTCFDAPDASGDWVGLDLGSEKVVTQVEYAPRAGWESRMVGGEIQASNSSNFSSGVVTLYKISTMPTADVLTTATFSNTTAYRYYRYIGPADSFCNIAELEFDG